MYLSDETIAWYKGGREGGGQRAQHDHSARYSKCSDAHLQYVWVVSSSAVADIVWSNYSALAIRTWSEDLKNRPEG